MIRALFVASLFGIAACGSSPCDNVEGACLGIRITSGPRIDQLAVVLTDAVTYSASTPATPGPLRTPPLETAIELPSTAAGTLHVEVLGVRDGVALARADGAPTIVAGGRQTIELALEATLADGGQPDLAGADLSAQVRYLFVLPMQSAAIGNITTADQRCTTQAHESNLGATTTAWHALLAYSGDGGDVSRLNNGDTRPIVLPDGTSLWPGGKFLNDHLPEHNPDELSTGEQVSGSCVWTGFGTAGNVGTTNAGRCDDWTYTGNNIDAAFAYTGTTASENSVTWSIDRSRDCSQSCHVYCIEE